MDSIDRREWLYTQSDDAVVAEICSLENQLSQTQERLAVLEADHLELGQLHTKNTVKLEEAEERLREAEGLLREGCKLLAWPNTDLMKLKIKAQAFLGKGEGGQNLKSIALDYNIKDHTFIIRCQKCGAPIGTCINEEYALAHIKEAYCSEHKGEGE